MAIEKDDFMKSFVSEIHVDGKQNIFLNPLMGDYRIRINELDEIEENSANLKLFLRVALRRTGWDAYTELMIDYNNHIIGNKILNPLNTIISNQTNLQQKIS